jgi:hypothetical protein
MSNRIGRRAAIAGVDRMAAEDIAGSIRLILPNKGPVVRGYMSAADAGLHAVSASSRSPAVSGAIGALAGVDAEFTENAVYPGRAIPRALMSFARASALAGEIVGTALGQCV